MEMGLTWLLNSPLNADKHITNAAHQGAISFFFVSHPDMGQEPTGRAGAKKKKKKKLIVDPVYIYMRT